MKNFKQKLIQTILAGIIGASTILGSGCGTLLNQESYAMNVRAPSDLEWQIYKKDSGRGIDKSRPYRTGRGNEIVPLSKTNFPDYYFSQDNGKTYEYILKCKTHPVALLNLFLGPGMFFAAQIDELSGGATKYDREDLTVHFFERNSNLQSNFDLPSNKEENKFFYYSLKK